SRGGIDLRLRTASSLYGVVELFSADSAFCLERRIACDVELEFLERRLLAREIGARFVERRSVWAVVDLEEEIARFQRSAVGVCLAQEVTLHARRTCALTNSSVVPTASE